MEPHFRLYPGQQALTPAQEAEAKRFAAQHVQAQLSTEPGDEQEAEAFLRQAYEAAGLAAPRYVHWLDGPLQLVAVLVPGGVWESGDERSRMSDWPKQWAIMERRVEDSMRRVWPSVKASVRDSLEGSAEEGMQARVSASLEDRVWPTEWDRIWAGVGKYVEDEVGARVWNRMDVSVGDRVWDGVWTSVRNHVRSRVWDNVGVRVEENVRWKALLSMQERVRASVMSDVEESLRDRVWSRVWNRVAARVFESVRASVRAYEESPWLACYSFFNVYHAPNALHALAHFTRLVSGFWLGQEAAMLVRRPKTLCRDAEGRLHNTSGKCIEYADGWGFYAWHGVWVPEQAILAPEALTREDFLNEPDVEVRRVIQERMGERFVSELGGQVLDRGPRGTLYEVRLPEDDPEGVARYVQVQDASTPRQYFLRVPPTVQTAAEAVAWSFQLAVKEYDPSHET